MRNRLSLLAGIFAVCFPALIDAGSVDTGATAVTTNGFPNLGTNAFTVFGLIADSRGNALAGVEVRACCGIGTLQCTGRTMSDANGKYVLAFGPGVLMGKLLSGGHGVGLQAATIFAEKSGYSCVELGRAGNLGMTDLDEVKPEHSRSFAGVVYRSKPYRLDFVLQPAASLKGAITSANGKLPEKLTLSLVGKVLPPSCSVLTSVELLQTNAFAFSNVPIQSNWWFEASWREQGQWKSSKTEPFACKIPTEHEATLEFIQDELRLRRLRSLR